MAVGTGRRLGRGALVAVVLLAVGAPVLAPGRRGAEVRPGGYLAAAVSGCFPDRDPDLPAPPRTVAAVAGEQPDPRPPAHAKLHIVIDVAERRLTLYRDGEPIRRFPVAVGKPGWASPVGEWQVSHKGRDWGGGFGTRWLGLNVPWGIYGIHGTNKDWSVGGAESHGCFRMFNRDVEDLWDMVALGTPVTVLGPWELPFWQSPARPPFRPGQNGQAIVYLQLLLRREGFDPGMADGRYHPGTEAAVRALERFYGLPEDGVADRLVLQFLDGREAF